MPRLKDNVSGAEERQPIAVYEGPLPPDGTYSGILRSIKLVTASTGTEFFNAFVVLDAKDKEGQNAAYDGAPTWTKVWRTDSDFAKSQRLALYKAVAGKGDVTIDVDDKVQGNPVVTKIGGVSPSGVRVYVQLVTEVDDTYGAQQKGLFVYPDPSAQNGQVKVEAEAEAEPEAEPEAEAPKRTRKSPAKKAATVTNIRKDEPEPEAEPQDRDDFDAMTLPQAREAAQAAGIETKGVSKRGLIAALKEQAGGGAEDRKLNPQDINKMSEEELAKFLYEEPAEGYPNGRYEEGDFDGMPRKDVIELLVEDEHILPI